MPGARLPDQSDAGSALQVPLLKAAAISMHLPSLLGAEEPRANAAPPSNATTNAASASQREHHDDRPAARGSRERRTKPVANVRLAEVPERGAVIAAMKRITPAVERCFGDSHGVAKVTFFVRGQTGKVTTARVTGMTGKPGSCIATVMRGVSLPPFQRAQLEISYPFSH